MKPRIFIAGLGGCSGCLSTLLSMDILGQVTDKFTIIHFPFILDRNDVKECDIAVIEGSVLSSTHVELLKRVREQAKVVVALGTCACFGGVQCMGASSIAAPLSTTIEVDVQIPGCPPPPGLLNEVTMQVMAGKRVSLPERNTCAGCERRDDTMTDIPGPITSLLPPDGADETRCFLKRGVLCLGPVTREGCDCRCIKKGMPCEGCMGPVPPAGYTASVMNFLSGVPVSGDLRTYHGYLFRFSRPRIATREVKRT